MDVFERFPIMLHMFQNIDADYCIRACAKPLDVFWPCEVE